MQTEDQYWLQTEDQRWVGLQFVMEELHKSRRTLHLLDQKQQSRKLMAKLTAVQRSAITEQFRAQTVEVAAWKANVNRLSASLKQFLGPAKIVRLGNRSKQILAEADERPDLELPEYESIPDLFTEKAAVQESVISK